VSDDGCDVLPLKDENPTRRTPVVTIAIIAACAWIYFAWQPSLGESRRVAVDTPAGVVQIDESIAFTLEHAAIPCEVVEGRPLTLDETAATFGRAAGDGENCGDGSPRSPRIFPDKSVWLALLTSMFLHGGLLHLGGNLLFLWIFGNNIEDHLGHLKFAIFYLIAGIAASALHIGLNLDSTVPVIGASGAIAGVMGVYLVWFPRAPVRTLIFLGFFVTMINVRAMWLLGFWFLSQFFTNPNSGVAWAAHVGGFVFGVLVGLLVRSSAPVRNTAWTRDHRTAGSWGGGWDDTGGARPPQRSRRGRWG
jgi:membrane associated rhomboid family serine protease